MNRNAWTPSVLAALMLLAAGVARAEECAATGVQPSDKLSPSIIDPCFENVAFGEARTKTIEHSAARVRTEYGALMMAEKSATEKDALKARMETDVVELGRNTTDFTGGASGFDASPVAADFAKHADEGVFEVPKGTDRVYFFYSQDQLWKIAWVLDAKQPFEDVAKHAQEVYGKGAVSKVDPKLTTWESKAMRVELIDQRPVFNAYVLRWTSKELAPKVDAYRKQKGAIVASPAAVDLGEDDVLNKAMGDGEKVDNVVDDILGAKPKAIPDVVGEAKHEKEEKDKAKGIIKKPPKQLKKAPGPQPKGM